MFRNQYDSDVTTWSPQGRLHQVEYAMEAVKQGSATVGLKNQTHAVLVAFKRRPSPLASYQEKVLTVDDHLGVSFAGLTADAKSLGRWMRTECLNSRYFHNTPLRVSTLTNDLGNKMQLCIQGYNKRPYGVGMLVAGFDSQGPHIVQTCPSANFYPCRAMAIGARSQSARTYLEKFLDEFKGCELEELVKHGLRALRDTLPNEVELNKENVTIAIVGKGHSFRTSTEAELESYLSMIEGEERRGGRPPPAEEEEKADEPEGEAPAAGQMETDD
jgi:20S proteasome subunit alpha 6